MNEHENVNADIPQEFLLASAVREWEKSCAIDMDAPSRKRLHEILDGCDKAAESIRSQYTRRGQNEKVNGGQMTGLEKLVEWWEKSAGHTATATEMALALSIIDKARALLAEEQKPTDTVTMSRKEYEDMCALSPKFTAAPSQEPRDCGYTLATCPYERCSGITIRKEEPLEELFRRKGWKIGSIVGIADGYEGSNYLGDAKAARAYLEGLPDVEKEGR